ncbi:MAG: hypothetical protein KC416_15175, partial [Myxococcales bacterium]|nr:hypothetical protein [Myxococcales bacterium]
ASIRLEETPSDPDFDWIFIGWPAVLRNPGCFVDRPLRISVRLRDKGGRIAQDERTIVPTGIHLPPCTPK